MNTYINEFYTNLPNYPLVFKNRVDEITNSRFLLLERRVPTLLLWGEAGAGKTSLALNLAYRLREESIYHSIVWTTAKKFELGIANPFNRTFFNRPYKQFSQERRRLYEGVLVESLLQLYQMILINSGFFEEHDENELTRFWNDENYLEARVLAWLKSRRILIFIDDLDSWEKTDWRYVLKFTGKISFPSAAVITSRRNIDPRLIPGVAPISVGPLGSSALKDIINDYVQEYGIRLEKTEIEDLLLYSGGNPLILNLMLGMIEIRSRHFWGRTSKVSREVLDEIVSSISSNKSIEDFLFKDLLENIKKESRMVIYAIAVLKQYEKPINQMTITQLTNLSKNEVEKAILELQTVSLLNRSQSDNDIFDIHPLVFDYLSRIDEKLMRVLVQRALA